METASPDFNVEKRLQLIVDDLDYGSRLPSLRRMSETIGVSVPVVNRYLSKFAASGQILIKPRSGAYKAMPVRRRIEFLIMNQDSVNGDFHYQYFLFSKLVNRLVCNQWQVRVHDLSDDCSPTRLAGLANPQNSLIVTFSLKAGQLPVIETMRESGVPMIHVIPNFTTEISPSIRIDDTEVVRAQITALMKRGHTRIAYLHAAGNGRYSRAWTQRFDAFCRLAIEYGLELCPEYLFDVGSKGERIPEAVAGFRRARTMPTAVISYDQHIRDLYNTLRGNGLEPGRDIAVFGTDDMPWSRMMTPALSTTRVSVDSCTELLHRAIIELEAGRQAENSFLEIQTVFRETT